MPKWGLPLADGVVGEVGEVLCGVGDAVRRDEVVVVVETDKVSVDIRAARDGVVAAVLSARGEEVSEGQPLMRFRPPSETVEVGGGRATGQRRTGGGASRRRRRTLTLAPTPSLAPTPNPYPSPTPRPARRRRRSGALKWQVAGGLAGRAG